MSKIDSLLPCPFCGAGTTQIVENGRPWLGTRYGEPVSISIRHWCENNDSKPSRMIERVGKDFEAARDEWNMRSNNINCNDTNFIDFIEKRRYYPIATYTRIPSTSNFGDQEEIFEGWMVYGVEDIFTSFRDAMAYIIKENR